VTSAERIPQTAPSPTGDRGTHSMLRADFDRCMTRLYAYFPNVCAWLKNKDQLERAGILTAWHDMVGRFDPEDLFEAGRYVATNRRSELYPSGFCAALIHRIREMEKQAPKRHGEPNCEFCGDAGEVYVTETRDWILEYFYKRGSVQPWIEGRAIPCSCANKPGECFVQGQHVRHRANHGAVAYQAYCESRMPF